MTTALSILQPWAWCIVNGHKSIENRVWAGKHRGRLLIHAGKGIDQDAFAFIRKMLPGVAIPPAGAIERGGVVGEVTMVDCVTSHPSPWFFGEYGFVFENPKVFQFMPVRGQLGFFELDLNALDVGTSVASAGQGSLF